MNVDVYDDSLNLLHHDRQYVSVANVCDVTVVQNSIDSSFGVVYSTVDGLFLSQLGRDLVPHMIGYRISATNDTSKGPSAAYSRGSLIVAWRSLRGGVVDIYGTTLDAPASVHWPSVYSGERQTRVIAGNGVNESVRISLSRPAEGDGVYRLVDVQGRTVLTEKLSNGDTMVEVAINDLSTGWYLLLLECGAISFTQPIVVVR